MRFDDVANQDTPENIVLLLTRLCKFLDKQSNQPANQLSTLLPLPALATLGFSLFSS
jgi:hypothetical protein